MTVRPPPPKPWERKAGVTSAEGGAPKPWDKPLGAETTVVSASGEVSTAAPGSSTLPGVGAPPARPWEAPSSGPVSTSYGAPGNAMTGYGSGSMYSRPAYGGVNSGGMYGSGGAYGTTGGMYGASPYGGAGMGSYGGSYGSGGMYGSSYGAGSMYGRPAGAGMYGAGGGMYGAGGGMYGGGMYGQGGGMYGQPGLLGGGPVDPNNPHAPPQPPSGWQAMLAGLGGLMHFFGRLSFLVDENAHAVHFFVSALLQLLDRAGSLYGELARFILRILGVRRAKKAGQALVDAAGPGQPPLPLGAPAAPKPLPAAASAAGGAPWDSVWKKQD
ncbi:PEX13 [Auxenochlorella protothecoides x Auxenochlorella symbiontica]